MKRIFVAALITVIAAGTAQSWADEPIDRANDGLVVTSRVVATNVHFTDFRFSVAEYREDLTDRFNAIPTGKVSIEVRYGYPAAPNLRRFGTQPGNEPFWGYTKPAITGTEVGVRLPSGLGVSIVDILAEMTLEDGTVTWVRGYHNSVSPPGGELDQQDAIPQPVQLA